MDFFLKTYNLSRVGVPGDGNCQFHSLSVFFDSYDHSAMRQIICKFIHRNKTIFQEDILNLGYDNVDKYILEMSRNGTWGDGITLQAFCMIFRVNVWLFMPTGVSQLCPKFEKNVAIIRNGNHYEAALPQ